MEKKTAGVFPGQGSQRAGMGKDFYDHVPESRQTYEEASDALGWDVAALCFAEDERLHQTEYTQPCLLTTEIAYLRGLKTLFDISPTVFGGHSLGEFTALVAAGVLGLPQAVKIVHIRGRLMQQAIPMGVGGMAAIIAQDIDPELLHITLADLPIDVANINSRNQVVISGKLDALPEAENRLKAACSQDDSFRFVPLKVSAPFHSRFMKSIETPFNQTLQELGKDLIPHKGPSVTSNFTGGFHSDSRDDIISRLIAQLSNTVRWVDNMKSLAVRANLIYEIGPGRPLKAFFTTIDAQCVSITTLSAARRLFQDAD